jgi:hypothetical protein
LALSSGFALVERGGVQYNGNVGAGTASLVGSLWRLQPGEVKMKKKKKSLTNLVKYEADGRKPVRDPQTLFGFDLLSFVGRRHGTGTRSLKRSRRKF